MQCNQLDLPSSNRQLRVKQSGCRQTKRGVDGHEANQRPVIRHRPIGKTEVSAKNLNRPRQVNARDNPASTKVKPPAGTSVLRPWEVQTSNQKTPEPGKRRSCDAQDACD